MDTFEMWNSYYNRWRQIPYLVGWRCTGDLASMDKATACMRQPPAMLWTGRELTRSETVSCRLHHVRQAETIAGCRVSESSYTPELFMWIHKHTTKYIIIILCRRLVVVVIIIIYSNFQVFYASKSSIVFHSRTSEEV